MKARPMEEAIAAEAKVVRRDERENTARGSKGERKRREEALAKASVKEDWQGMLAPLFRSRKRGQDGTRRAITARQAERIVRAAASRADVQGEVSPHWMRHAHASHALERGAKVHLVKATLGHASVATTGRYLHARPDEYSAMYLAT